MYCALGHVFKIYFELRANIFQTILVSHFLSSWLSSRVPFLTLAEICMKSITFPKALDYIKNSYFGVKSNLLLVITQKAKLKKKRSRDWGYKIPNWCSASYTRSRLGTRTPGEGCTSFCSRKNSLARS